MKKIFLLVLLWNAIISNAQTNFSFNTIKSNFLKNANAIKRYENTVVEVFSKNKAIITTSYAITVLNQRGADFAALSEHYDKLISIKNIDGHLYDANGKKVKSLKNKELKDFSRSSSSFYDDDREKQHQFDYPSFPYTVEYIIEKEMKGIFYLPSFYPLNSYNISLEKASFTVICPLNYDLRFKQFNFAIQPIVTDIKNGKQHFWEINNLDAISKEWRTSPFESFLPFVAIAPSDFEIQDFVGKQNTWKEFGEFINTLNFNRSELPENIVLKVKELVKDKPNDKEKTLAVYDFFQKNTRYISIQLGIGGWQTFPAKYVAEKGYGDCKALSNYMVSLLKAVGIKSYYTLIEAGEKPQFFMPDFPSNQFNHIIVNVPLQNDTMWLECTSQDIAPGYLGSFTANRYALLITENGGVLVKTPKYAALQNAQLRKIEGVLNLEGQLNAKIVTEYCGEQQDDLQQSIKSSTKYQLLQNINENLAMPSYNVSNLEYKEYKTAIPTIKESFDLQVNNFASLTGKRLYFAPNIYNKSGVKVNTDEPRISNISNAMAFKDVDSISITIPEGYMVESKIENKVINSNYGNYKITVNYLANTILYIRELIVPIGEYNKNENEKIANWYKDIYKADRQMITFVKQN